MGDRAIERLAALQHGCVHRRQLSKAGITRHGLRWRLAHGRLFRISRDVFLVGRRTQEQFTAEMAALLKLGGRAVLGGRSAAYVWQLVEQQPEPVELTYTGAGRRSPPNTLLRRSCHLTREVVRWRRELALLDPYATLIELAGILDAYELENAVAQGLRTGTIRRPKLERRIHELGYSPTGIGTLRTLLNATASPLDTRSRYERELLKLIRDAGLPVPATNVYVGSHLVDFYWRQQRLVVEFDSYAFHDNPRSFQTDRRRDQDLMALGISTIRITAQQLDSNPIRISSLLTTALLNAQAGEGRPRRIEPFDASV